jgi:cell wall-associated NlpC family hydrolase
VDGAPGDTVISAVSEPEIDTLQVASELGKIDFVINFSERFLGTPYLYGGKRPGGFDCSGFVGYVFGQLGYNTPASSSLFRTYGSKVSRSACRPGDIICFKGRNQHSANIGHVGIIVEANPSDIHFIHASVNKGITYDRLSSAYYKPRFVQIRRVLH